MATMPIKTGETMNVYRVEFAPNRRAACAGEWHEWVNLSYQGMAEEAARRLLSDGGAMGTGHPPAFARVVETHAMQVVWAGSAEALADAREAVE
jgi:hypothetical protein